MTVLLHFNLNIIKGEKLFYRKNWTKGGVTLSMIDVAKGTLFAQSMWPSLGLKGMSGEIIMLCFIKILASRLG